MILSHKLSRSIILFLCKQAFLFDIIEIMKKVILFLGLLLGINLLYTLPAKAVNPLIAIEGVGLGLNILKDVTDKVKDSLGSKKKKKQITKSNFICLNHSDKKSSNLKVSKFDYHNYNYEICVDKSTKRSLYNDLAYYNAKGKISITAAYNVFDKHNHWYRNKLSEKRTAKKKQNLNETDMLVEWVDMADQDKNINLKNFKSMSVKFHASGINYWQRYDDLNINSNVKHARELCEWRVKQRNISNRYCNLETISIKYLNGEKEYYKINSQSDLNLIVNKIKNKKKNQTLLSSNSSSFNWYAVAKHPKTNNEFIATKVSNEKDARRIAISKCYEFVKTQLSQRGFNDCYISVAIDGTKNYTLSQELIAKQNNSSISKVKLNSSDMVVDWIDMSKIENISLGNVIDFNLNYNENIFIDGKSYEFKVFKDNKARDGSKRKVVRLNEKRNNKIKNVYYIIYYKNGGKELIELQNPNTSEIYWVHEIPAESSPDWFTERTIFRNKNILSGRYIQKSTGKILFGSFDTANKTTNSLGSWEVWGFNQSKLKSETKLSTKLKKEKFKLSQAHFERSKRAKQKVQSIERELEEKIFKGQLSKFIKKEIINKNTKVAKKEPKNKLKKKINSENNELDEVINKISRLMPGDYYLFAHSTTGEKFWGSTKAKNKTTQIGKATSSSGYTCDLISKQKTKFAPFKGSFELKCPNEKINGSWTQDSGYSPGIGQAFTKRGEVITAFFSNKQSVISNFAKKYYGTKDTQVAKKEEPKLEEFKPDANTQSKNKPPKLIVKNNYTFKNSSYEIVGTYEDEQDNIFIEVDGRIIQANNGKFSIQRFSPVDEQIKLVAIDKWGKRSEPQIINVKIEFEDTILAETIEPLNPKNIRSRSSNNKVALIIGIENYSETPQATYANLDAQFFAEYSKKAFGVKSSNINLLIDEEATFVKTSKALTKWLNSKIKRNQSELIIFFAGHGLASNDGKELYLLPQDSDPDLLSRTALSRTELFKEILALNPKSVTMFLDTCYSGQTRDEKTLLASARPIRIVADENEDVPGNFTIFSASQLDQISSGLKEAEHGIFSYYLMKGLEGNADQNDDRKITNGELLAYMDENISQKASELGRVQNPSLTGDPNQVLSRY